jgi:Zn-dependent protease
MDLHNALINVLVAAIPVIFAITLHEAAHGYVAKYFGDATAYMMGRVTLNPAKHIDPVGTLLVPAVTLFLGGFLFGWAKPVPVNYRNLRNPKRDSMWVALAGPLANVAQVVIWAIVARVLLATIDPTGLVGPFWVSVCEEGIKWNILFALLNLLPILPLDGGRVVASLLPDKLSYAYSRTEGYGIFILLFLILVPPRDPVLGYILGPPFKLAMDGTYQLFGF